VGQEKGKGFLPVPHRRLFAYISLVKGKKVNRGGKVVQFRAFFFEGENKKGKKQQLLTSLHISISGKRGKRGRKTHEGGKKADNNSAFCRPKKGRTFLTVSYKGREDGSKDKSCSETKGRKRAFFSILGKGNRRGCLGGGNTSHSEFPKPGFRIEKLSYTARRKKKKEQKRKKDDPTTPNLRPYKGKGKDWQIEEERRGNAAYDA